MFGNPSWFSTGKNGRLLLPAGRSGVIYYALWAIVILLPLAMLRFNQQGLESVVWLVVSVGVFVLDYRATLKKKHEQIAYENLHFIDDDENRTVHTEQHEIYLKS